LVFVFEIGYVVTMDTSKKSIFSICSSLQLHVSLISRIFGYF